MKLRVVGLTVLLGLWLAASYALRYQLMEQVHWLAVCQGAGQPWLCAVRHSLGLAVHFHLLSLPALVLAIAGFCWRGRGGRLSAGLAFVPGIPALVLYSATLGALAIVIAAVRLVRAGPMSASTPPPCPR